MTQCGWLYAMTDGTAVSLNWSSKVARAIYYAPRLSVHKTSPAHKFVVDRNEGSPRYSRILVCLVPKSAHVRLEKIAPAQRADL